MAYDICRIENGLVFIAETYDTHEVAEHRTYILNETNKSEADIYFYRHRPSEILRNPAIKHFSLGEELYILPEESKEDMYDRLVEKFGTRTQMIVATEECSELIKEISKILRLNLEKPDYVPSYEYLAEEIADVTIMCEQLVQMFGINSDVEKFKIQKLERIEQLLAE